MRRIAAVLIAAVLLLLGGAVAFPDSDMPITVEAAFGADLTADPASWSYTDISTRLTNVPITKRAGRPSGAQQADAGSMSLTIDNSDGALTPLNPSSTYYPNVVLGLPIRVTINPTGTPTVWFSGYADSWAPDLIPTTEDGVFLSVVRVTASGILRRLSQGARPLRSALFRSMSGVAPGDYVPHAYWSMEDGTDATQFAASVAGVAPAKVTGGFSPGSTSTPAGSEPLATFDLNSKVYLPVPAYTNTQQWAVQWVVNIPSSPAADPQLLAEFPTPGGTVARWTLTLEDENPSPDAIYIRGYNSAGVEVTSGGTAIDAGDLGDSTDFYGHTFMFTVAAYQDGGDVTCWFEGYREDGLAMERTFADEAGTHGALSGSIVLTSPINNTVMGHVGLFTDPNFSAVYAGSDAQVNAAAMDGHAGEQAHERAERLAREERVPITITGSSSQTMGPQTTGSLLENLQECETVNTGGLGEDGFGLHFICLPERYNRTVDLTIDLSTYRTTAGTSDQVLRPVFDDQRYRNRWTVDRPSGSQAIADLSTGSLLYEDSVTANVETDGQLSDQAAWRVNRDSIIANRYAEVPVDLAANTGLIDDWLAIVPGLSRIQRTNLPADHFGEVHDELVEGIIETLARRQWTARYNGSPFAAYLVAELDDDTLGKLDTDGTELVASVSNSATSLTVLTTTPGSPLWTTDGGEMPIPLIVAGEVMSVTAVASVASDAYTRTVGSGLGTATSGQSYSIIGTAAEYAVNGSNAVITPSAVNNDRGGWIDVGSPDQHARVRLNTNTLPVGGSIDHGLLLRVADAQNFYRVTASVAVTTGLITINIAKRVANVLSTVSTVTTNLTMTGTDLYVEASVIGTDIRARVYGVSAAVPGWMHVVSDSSLTGGNGVGIFFRRNTSNSSPTAAEFDNLEVFNPQVMTVTRSVNGVSKSQAAGAAVNVYRPARLAL